jgi:hypothetical protein
MYRHTKAATLLFPAIAGLLSLAISSSVLAQRAGNRGAVEEQDNTVSADDNSQSDRPRQRGEQVRTEPARNDQQPSPREQQTAPRQQEYDSTNNSRDSRREYVRDNSQPQIVRQQSDRDDLGQRRQQQFQNAQAEREASAERIAQQRGSVDRARQNREQMNPKPLLLADSRNQNQPGYVGEPGRDHDRNENRQDRNNYGSSGNGITYDRSPGNVAYNPGRSGQEQQQRQWQDQQQRQANDYRRHLDGQQPTALRIVQSLRHQNRNEQYRSQQRYYDRMNQQRRYHDNHRNNDYYRGSYQYSPVIYRYSRGGSYYYANRYQADLMRQAINYGYEEGYYAGRADRMDRWGFNYRDAYAYQDANYGYSGYYVDRGTYNYYFREGFSRGYEDGYYSRHRYGRSYNNGYSLNDSVFRLILNLSNWR